MRGERKKEYGEREKRVVDIGEVYASIFHNLRIKNYENKN